TLFRLMGEQAAGTVPSRKLLSSYDLADPATLEELYTNAVAAVGGAIDSEALTAIADAVARLNSLSLSSPDVRSVQRISILVQSRLQAQVEALATGMLDVDTFVNETSQTSYINALDETDVPGSLYGDPYPGEDSSSGGSNGGLIGGLIGGLVGGTVLIAGGLWLFLVWRRRYLGNREPRPVAE
ncbi:hypothetical protein H632_c2310p0, partial [Helicosporidium sp. ATCC 50920]